MKPKEESFPGPPSQNGHRRDSSLLDGYTTSQIRVITLRRRGNMPLGFSIRGGWEHGTGIFVSEVQPGSIAQRQGLRVGDQIVRINGFSIHRAIHMEVLSLLKTCPGVVLKVKRVGILPVKEKRKDPVTWKVVEASHSLSQSNLSGIHQRTSAFIPENCIIVKIEFSVPLSTSLGCSIAKGPQEMPGIFMCTVKEGGVASQAGLEVGDQILDMNGTSFIDIKLPEAVALMKSAKDIRLTVKKGAGICLFADNSMDDHSVANGHDNNHSQYSPDSKACSTLSSRQTDGGLKEHDFSGSSSGKSEASSFQSSVSSDSEKDYSISEESGIDGMKPQQNGTNPGINGWHKKTASRGSNDSGSSSSGHGATLRDDSWIAEERRKLEEEQRRLAEEKERLEAEKKKLELEKKFQVGPKHEEAAPKGSFLHELQKAAAKMSIQDEKMDIDQLMLEKRCSSSKSNTLKYGENGKNKCQEDIIKRRQHEMLMEEFREAHKKMFGQQQNGVSSESAQNGPLTKVNGKPHVIVNSSGFLTTAKCSAARSKPPAPPVPSDAKDSDSHKQKTHITVNGQVPSLFSQTLPRPERVSPSKAKTSVDDMDAENSKSPSSPVSFKITFDTKNRSSTDFGATSGKQVSSTSPSTEKSDSSQCPLVEVNPWTTRL